MNNNLSKLILGLLTIGFLLASCTKKNEYASIKGVYKGIPEGKEIHLSKVAHGQLEKIAVTSLGADGRFGFTYSVDEPALYVTNIVWKKSQKTINRDHNLTRFYLANGDELNINLWDDKYELIQTNTAANKLLTEWNNQVDSLYTFSHGFAYTRADYQEFFPLIENFEAEMISFQGKIKTSDKHFNELLKLLVETDLSYSCLNFLFTPRPKHADRADYPEFYDKIIEMYNPKSDLLLHLPIGSAYMHIFNMFAQTSLSSIPSTVNKRFDIFSERFGTDLLKGYYALYNLHSFKTYDSEFLTYRKKVEPFLVSDYLKQKMQDYEISIRKFERGALAFDFTGYDMTNQAVKLSDFKDQIVYVDIWATWCKPCTDQIPYLKKLEKKFQGKPITFLSLSLDDLRDRKKWEEFVESKELGGIQLMSDKGFDSDIAKAYSITSIPRFLLIDKQGKIISSNAVRPSEENTEALLNSLL
ncbi:TlpA family protein disulfide reductase [Carboxylicivirga marina]|uniref:AhpC/TSA family protein n=1 Tax=Carboxylicivirga marina TaxID=2800988 RepID=A0ABS1HH41_9BACT|nr:TlpA disulfide reductase family protein [Carboxylicivirga marina]MBK3516992.1 AhpC/TSA family protein [Carboxylicivirga marina]